MDRHLPLLQHALNFSPRVSRLSLILTMNGISRYLVKQLLLPFFMPRCRFFRRPMQILKKEAVSLWCAPLAILWMSNGGRHLGFRLSKLLDLMEGCRRLPLAKDLLSVMTLNLPKKITTFLPA